MSSASLPPPHQQQHLAQPDAALPPDAFPSSQQQQQIQMQHVHMHSHHHNTHPAAVASQSHALAVAHAAEAVSAAAANSAAADQSGPSAVNPNEVGWLFVQQYYTFLNKEPKKLHCFFNSKSSFIHGMEGESLEIQQGQKEIQARIAELDFEDCKVLVSNVDSQLSHNGCIVVMVLGEMSNKQASSHKFCQCFVLAEQPSGYFVYNDIFRFLKEDIDNEYDEPSDPLGTSDSYQQQLQLQHSLNSHSNHSAIDTISQGAQTSSTVAVPSQSPIPQASHFQRGRSPSPKKLATPQPVASTLPVPTAAHEKSRSRSPPAMASISAEATTFVPPALTDKKDSDGFGGSWGDTASASISENGAATKHPDGNLESPAKAPTAAGAAGGKKKHQASVVASVGGPVDSSAVPPKPKTWATLAAGGSLPTGTVGNTVAAVSVADKPSSPIPVAAKTEIKGAGKSNAPLVVKKMPIPHGSHHPPSEAQTEEQVQFREIQRKPVSGSHSGGNNGVSGNRNYNNQYQQKQLTKEDYLRSIFFMLPQDIPGVNGGPPSSSLGEEIIQDFFDKNVGSVVEVMIPRGKPLCFVEFVDPVSAELAIGKTVLINGHSITPEQRKPRYTGYQNNGNYNNYNNGGGRGGMRYNGQSRGGLNSGHGGGARQHVQQGKAAAGV
ncbi:hypothetical protein HDU82_005966 [Entophlyctis luteolus]|nr:hypothetical protein HDU82_005966 [Entophlyctis luteolus]KAJ3388703.1 hypothetical protein HDU84_009548 [Entophlyctis sp. JEL0112]